MKHDKSERDGQVNVPKPYTGNLKMGINLNKKVTSPGHAVINISSSIIVLKAQKSTKQTNAI